jgi:hypothetical protein
VSRLRSATSAKEVLELVCRTELDAPILPRKDPRWERLRFGIGRSVNLRDRGRGVLIGGAIGGAMGRPNTCARPCLVPPGRPLQRMGAAQVDHPIRLSEAREHPPI